MIVAARVVSGIITVAFLAFTCWRGTTRIGAVVVQPAPLQSHQITPAQSGVESHQDEIAQPRRGGSRPVALPRHR